jgi:formylglycine-generating enzyme required for sulfatase activity/tRNA A-37 threonylcarbamoyl transferase component Bud32
MLQTAWAAFEGRVRSEAPGLLEDLRALASLVSPGAASGAEPTLPRPPFAAPLDPTPAAPASRPPEASDPERYEVLGPLGRGGTGTVERVRDRWLHRVVARKVIHPGMAPESKARFLAEARATAQLQHPGIVPVHDVGETSDGRLWFTMTEVQGDTFWSVIRREHRSASAGTGDRPVALRRLVATFHAVCQAVGYAHERGVVHRDLKPANVMVGAHGEVLVVDWGLAKVVTPSGRPDAVAEPVHTGRPTGEETGSGAVMGTPAFMSPEQARGEGVDARSDVYALGAMLYEALTGAAPYRGTSSEVVAAVLAGPPPSLRGPAGASVRARFGVDVEELVEVCERAMSRSPSDRFAAGSAVAEAVQSWLDGSRRREQALAVVAAAAAKGPEAAALRAAAAALRAGAAAALKGVEGWRPEEDKAAAWAEEDEAESLEVRASLLDLAEEQLLHASLTHAPELPEAHAALAERYLREHEAAEAARGSGARPEALLRTHLAALPEGHPVRRSGFAYLQGDGALTLRTDPEGAVVELFRYEPRNRRLVAVPERALGRTPLVAVPLARGSYLCVVRHPERAPVRYPVHIGRGEHWDGVPPEGGGPQPVYLPRPGELGPDDCYVPPGWFWSGGDPMVPNTLPRRRLWVDGQVFRRFPVTNREYLRFLDALVASGREEEALRYAPRERAGTAGEQGALIYGYEDGQFRLRPDADGDVWALDWPVMMVDWYGAAGFAAWEAERTGQPWRLPGELDWEKAARGVDGRWFPWGDHVDPSWACSSQSHRRPPLPAVVDSYPVDESVYGVRGLGGNMRDWCTDGSPPDGPVAPRARAPSAADPGGADRVLRGGSWNLAPAAARVTFRNRNASSIRYNVLGFRLARSLP